MAAKPFALTPFEPVYTENDVEALARNYWKARGWHVVRQHVGRFRARNGAYLSIGTAGMTDYLVMRPVAGIAGRCHVAYVEIKQPGEVPEPHQLAWMELQRLAGFEAVWFDRLQPLAVWFEETFG